MTDRSLRIDLPSRSTDSILGIGAEKAKKRQSLQIKNAQRRLLFLALLSLIACFLYMTIGVDFSDTEMLFYAWKLRLPKLVVMLLTAWAIGGASLVFQSIIRNTIVTPCLLGMNSLYTLIHTAVIFVLGSGSILATNANLTFAVDVVLMGIIATAIYSYLFKKTGHNVLYVLLVGTILTSFFSSMQTTMTRLMDPNEYDALLSTLIASFSRSNTQLILFGAGLMLLIVFFLRKDLALLDVITLGKDVAINLGVPYERTIRRLLLGVVLCIAVATALVGPISFLGLIIANLGRQYIKGYRHRHLIPASASFGVIALVGGQVIVEEIFHYAVPISVFVTVAGGIYFLYLILTKKSLI